jgi:outer membrane cobalamin receptor
MSHDLSLLNETTETLYNIEYDQLTDHSSIYNAELHKQSKEADASYEFMETWNSQVIWPYNDTKSNFTVFVKKIERKTQ